ncbi:MAG: thermonuclease family protein [Gemmatimonadaceae bacterium]
MLTACMAAGRDQESDSNIATSTRPTPDRLVTGDSVACTVTRISDGDSFRCGDAGRVRLLLIDAPELAQGAAGEAARRVLLQLMPPGTHIVLRTDVTPRDSFNRILGYAYLADGRMINEEMARSGYVTALVYPPNVQYVERIRSAVADARRMKRGLYATNFFDCPPRDFRAGRCGLPLRRAP